MNRVETHLPAILMGIALVSVAIFFMHNGFCCSGCTLQPDLFPAKFRRGVKRFFYFFIPAMLVVYFRARQQSVAVLSW